MIHKILHFKFNMDINHNYKIIKDLNQTKHLNLEEDNINNMRQQFYL